MRTWVHVPRTWTQLHTPRIPTCFQVGREFPEARGSANLTSAVVNKRPLLPQTRKARTEPQSCLCMHVNTHIYRFSCYFKLRFVLARIHSLQATGGAQSEGHSHSLAPDGPNSRHLPDLLDWHYLLSQQPPAGGSRGAPRTRRVR